MTITVTIHYSEGEHQRTSVLAPSDSALADVRFRFNPSGLKTVEDIKAVAALLITLAQEVGEREGAEARTLAQTASMWAVAGATRGL